MLGFIGMPGPIEIVILAVPAMVLIAVVISLIANEKTRAVGVTLAVAPLALLLIAAVLAVPFLLAYRGTAEHESALQAAAVAEHRAMSHEHNAARIETELDAYADAERSYSNAENQLRQEIKTQADLIRKMERELKQLKEQAAKEVEDQPDAESSESTEPNETADEATPMAGTPGDSALDEPNAAEGATVTAEDEPVETPADAPAE